ncbi:hypothetical protein QA644_21255 (plasmid) [Rhizobium sp. CC1099]|nr:hypothetical protein [Rhizobium sp. CC1099]WFU90813.1 hypothetical protein QA644_21255 [Rhizobium sp. CC1099]
MTTVAKIWAVRLGRQRSPDQHTGQFATKYVRAANITANGIDVTDVLEMDFSPAERQVFQFQVGDILLGRGGRQPQAGRARGNLAGRNTRRLFSKHRYSRSSSRRCP